MISIGLTGGIGSGKTYICRVFEALSIPVFYADVEAKACYEDPLVLQEMKEYFGQEIVTEQGLNKAALAKVVFSDDRSLAFLNQLIHPQVKQRYKLWIEQQQSPYVIHEAALIYESDLTSLFDQIICVYTPKEIAISRVVERDGMERTAIEQRMQHQIAPEKKRDMASYVIFNDGIEMLMPQILKLHNSLLNQRFSLDQHA